MNICNIDEVELTQLELKEPIRIQGGAFFSQLKHKNEDLYINTPKSNTKNGIVRTGKRMYADLLYDENNNEMANWILDLEKVLKQKLFEKSSLWFHNEMDLDDIDYFFNSPLRTYKGNKYLLRCNVVNNTKNPSSYIQIYDESENLKDISDVEGKNILSIIQIKGIRFTSNSFHLEIVLRQTMILDDKPLFSGCLIKPSRQNVATPRETIDTLLVEPNIDDKDDNSSISSSMVLDNESHDLEDLTTINTENEKSVDKNEEQTSDKQKQVSDKQEQTSDKQEQTSDKEENQSSDKEKVIKVDTHENSIDKQETQPVNKECELEQVDSLEVINDKESILEETMNELKEIQDLGIVKNTNDNLEEFSLDIDSLENDTPMILKKPNEVYYEIYREARRKAKIAKKAAVIAYLEAKNIKNTYMLDDIDDSSDEEFDTDDFDLEQNLNGE